jgi:hypothetical protein
VWDIFGPADKKPGCGTAIRTMVYSNLKFGNAVLHIDGFANSAEKVVHQHCFFAHNPLEEADEGADVLPDWCQASGFLLVNCADHPRRFHHQDPNALRSIVTVPAKGVHWFPGLVQFGIVALPFKGHNLSDKGHTTLGRMPFITLQCWRSNMSDAQRTRNYAGPHVDKCPVYYRPYRMN